MRIALIVNPGSGGGTDPGAVAAAIRAAGGEPVDGEAADVERVAVAAGDGMVALAAARAGELGVPLAVLPAGTANDFAREHGLPDTLDAAAELAVRGDRTTALELAFMDGRPFVNVASCGLAPVAAERAAPLKPRFGALAYALGALAATARAVPVTAGVSVDGEPLFEGDAWQVTVASSGAFGGGSSLDAADSADGLLDAVVLPAGARIALARRGYGMRRGNLASQAAVPHARGSSVALRVPARTAFNVDGEIIHAGPAITFTARAGAFALVVG